MALCRGRSRSDPAAGRYQLWRNHGLHGHRLQPRVQPCVPFAMDILSLPCSHLCTLPSQHRSCTFGLVCVSDTSAADLALRRVTRRLNKDDRTLEMPEDPAIGAAFQQHKLRRCAPSFAPALAALLALARVARAFTHRSRSHALARSRCLHMLTHAFWPLMHSRHPCSDG